MRMHRKSVNFALKHIRYAWAWLEGVTGVCFKFLPFPLPLHLHFPLSIFFHPHHLYRKEPSISGAVFPQDISL